jgi:aminoglycoside phosphotransferase (APT) family kinase protein
MGSAAATLLHGDAKLWNLGLEGDRLVAIDWGDLTGIGPAEIDLAWFAVTSRGRIEWTPDEVFAAYETQGGRRLDPRALDLACIGALAQLGFSLAGLCLTGDEPVRARTSERLAWWVTRVRKALLTWSPG